MARGGTFRSTVLPLALALLWLVALLVCVDRAMAGTRFADDVRGGYGGLAGGLGVGVTTVIATRRARRRTREMLPQTLTADQREQVVAAASCGPLPADPLVRVEARRLAEQWAGARGSSARTSALVLAVLALACLVAGAAISAWWWGGGVLLVLPAGLVLRRDRQWARQLSDLRQSTDLPVPPPEGVHRLLETEPLPDLEGSDRGVLELRVRKPRGGANVSSVVVRIGGQVVPAEWGRNRYLVPAGTSEVAVSIDYLFDYGRATTAVVVPAGAETVLHYSQPALTLLGGRIGTEPQRSAGAVGLAVALAALVAAFVGLAIGLF